VNNATETVYIGSSVNLGLRVMSHLIYGSSNERLQNYILKNGLENFMLIIMELYEMDPDLTDRENITQLLAIEQKYLDMLFTQPAKIDTTLVRLQALP
jgi:group I intron endonuclease